LSDPAIVALALKLGACALGGTSAFGFTYVLGSVPVPLPPRLGHRGAERIRANARSPLFGLGEPALRFAAGCFALLPLANLRQKQELELQRAAYPLGLGSDEYGALAVISAIMLGATALGLAAATNTTLVVAIPAVAFGLILPKLQVQEVVRKRVKDITRGLPHAIEIAALCMSAGADFPGALRLIATTGGRTSDDALRRELSLILEELELGHTRREALVHLSERVPSPAVRDFVNAVIQAEEKGNPLARVIQIQGRTLNQRRSVAAEEAAARAGVLMIAPLMLLLCAILLLLMGPFIVSAGAL
jgi:tight adherence protein C